MISRFRERNKREEWTKNAQDMTGNKQLKLDIKRLAIYSSPDKNKTATKNTF